MPGLPTPSFLYDCEIKLCGGRGGWDGGGGRGRDGGLGTSGGRTGGRRLGTSGGWGGVGGGKVNIPKYEP